MIVWTLSRRYTHHQRLCCIEIAVVSASFEGSYREDGGSHYRVSLCIIMNNHVLQIPRARKMPSVVQLSTVLR